LVSNFSLHLRSKTASTDVDPPEATEKNVPPAADKVTGDLLPAEELQLTDDLLASLTDAELTNITYFQFDDDEPIQTRRSLGRRFFGKCKTYPGDLLWPVPVAWKVFDLLLGGALIKTVPIGSPCYDSGLGTSDDAACTALNAKWSDSMVQQVFLIPHG
jgi:hypothetical protein